MVLSALWNALPSSPLSYTSRAMSWVTYLLASPTRSSFVGVAAVAELQAAVAAHNGESVDYEVAGTSETLLGRPWALVSQIPCETREEAEAVAAHVAQMSGFRARHKAMAECSSAAMRAALSRERGFDAEAQGRDGMTYAVVEFANPAEPSRTVRVEALVDTGATDCEISQSLIDELGLTPFDQATFETAAGISMSSALYRAIVRVEGRESLVLLSPSEKDEEEDSDDSEDAEDAAARAADAALDAAHGFKAISDDGLLGHDALAALGLLVDCGRRKLVPAP